MTESTSQPTIYLYAKADRAFAARIGEQVFAEVTDPRHTGTPDPEYLRVIEVAGSLDLNLALYDGKTSEVKPLEGFAAKLAESIAIDMMVVHVGRMRPDVVVVDVYSLAESCAKRIDKLVGATNTGRSAIPPQGGWHIVELMGQKRYSAFVTEVYIAGQRMLQLAIPTDSTGENRTLKFVGSRGAIYAITQCDEAEALGLARLNRPAPFESWEIRKGREEVDGNHNTSSRNHVGQHDDDSSPDSEDGPDSEEVPDF
jgi:hypothetical protein